MNEKNEYELDGTSLTVHLPAEVDHPVSDSVRKVSDRIMGRDYIRTMIFDFKGTCFMDSSGIGLLMGRYRALGMKKGCVKAVNVNGHIHRILQLSGVHRYIEIQRNQEEGEE